MNATAPHSEPERQPPARELPSLGLPAIRELAKRRQWVLFRFETRGGVRTKIPLRVDGTLASSTDPQSWASFDEAAQAFVSGIGDGVGFVVTAADPYVGVDLDHVLIDGRLADWAAAIVAALKSYTEITPSGAGLRVWVRGKLPPTGRKRGNIEMYSSARFFTVTGAHVEGTPDTIEDRHSELADLHRRTFGIAKGNGSAPPEAGTDCELPPSVAALAQRQPRVHALLNSPASAFEGRFPSESEADLALADLCARNGITHAEIAAALRWRRDRFGAKRKGADYFHRTAAKAIESAAGESEPPPHTDRDAPGAAGPHSEQEPEAEPWDGPPMPLGQATPAPFPIEALPAWARAWATAEAEAQQVPLDMPSVLVLGVCSAAVAGRARVLVKPGHSEPLNLYLASVLAPGNRKSSTFSDATRPLAEHELELSEQARPQIASAAAALEILRGRLAEATRAAAREREPAKISVREAETSELSKAIAEAERKLPAQPRMLCDDVTPEALAHLLERQGGTMAVFSPEGGELFEMLRGRYSQNARSNFGVFLSGWSGDPICIDRRGGGTIRVQHPTLTICMTAQPSVIQGLGDSREFRGRGLLGRFLFSLPESRLGTRDSRSASVPEHVEAAYQRHVRALLRLPRCDRVLDLAPAARERWLAFSDALEPRLAESGDLGAMADWAGKLGGMVARLAGVLSAMEWADQADPFEQAIDEVAMERAERLGGYFLEHAKLAFDLMGRDENMEAARRIWAWIAKAGVAEVSKRDLWQQFKGGLVRKAAELDAPLELLCEQNYLRRKAATETPAKGGRRSEIFEVNPVALR